MNHLARILILAAHQIVKCGRKIFILSLLKQLFGSHYSEAIVAPFVLVLVLPGQGFSGKFERALPGNSKKQLFDFWEDHSVEVLFEQDAHFQIKRGRV